MGAARRLHEGFEALHVLVGPLGHGGHVLEELLGQDGQTTAVAGVNRHRGPSMTCTPLLLDRADGVPRHPEPGLCRLLREDAWQLRAWAAGAVPRGVAAKGHPVVPEAPRGEDAVAVAGVSATPSPGWGRGGLSPLG